MLTILVVPGRFGRKRRRAKIVIPKKEAYLLRNRNAHITDYKELQGKYLDAETQEKHMAILMNDIGEDMEPTVEVVGGIAYHLVATYRSL